MNEESPSAGPDVEFARYDGTAFSTRCLLRGLILNSTDLVCSVVQPGRNEPASLNVVIQPGSVQIVTGSMTLSFSFPESRPVSVDIPQSVRLYLTLGTAGQNDTPS
jgi:hypothetical protein